MFGSSALSYFLHAHPNSFVFTQRWNTGVNYDFIRLDRFKHSELQAFIPSTRVDCLVLIDALVPKQNARDYLRENRAELGPGSIFLVSSLGAVSNHQQYRCH